MTQPVAHFIPPGTSLISGQTVGEPTVLLEEIFRSVAGVDDVKLFGGMSLTGVFSQAPSNFALSTFVGIGRSAELIAAGRMDLVPCHMSDLPRNLRAGSLRADVALVLVSPPNREGMCSLGPSSDYAWTAACVAPVVLAEINRQVPTIPGDTAIPFENIRAYVETDRALPEQPRVRPSDLERAIARRIASYVGNGSCIQVGVGRLGEAVLEAVGGRKDLGVHSGMVGDTVLEMVQEGVITNAHKGIDTGLTVSGSVLGTARAVAMASADRRLRMRSIDYTHDPSVIARLGDVVCINSAIEVDLLGQVNAEVADGVYVGGVGGAVDFLRSSVQAGGRSIVALPSTAKDGAVSRIVPVVQRVTALRSDIDLVITEHGVADLRGTTEGERASRIIALAAPRHRDRLRLAAADAGL